MSQKCSQNSNEREIKEKIVELIKEVNTKIEAWIENGSDVRLEKVEKAYLNLSRYDPPVARTYMPLLKKLQDEIAMINVQNRRADNECLKWSLQMALSMALESAPCWLQPSAAWLGEPHAAGAWGTVDGVASSS